MKAKDSRGARRAAALELWLGANAAPLAASFPEHWRALNDDEAQKRHAADQRKKIRRTA